MASPNVLNDAQPMVRPVGPNQAGVCRQVLASAGSVPCVSANPALRQSGRYAVWVYPRARTGVAL